MDLPDQAAPQLFTPGETFAVPTGTSQDLVQLVSLLKELEENRGQASGAALQSVTEEAATEPKRGLVELADLPDIAEVLNNSRPQLPPGALQQAADKPSLGLRLDDSTKEWIQLKLQAKPEAQSLEFGSQAASWEQSKLSPVELGKLKAANLYALSIQCGSWERHARHDGDVLCKFYYAKRKLVWEVMEMGLKSKVEAQWSDITDFRVLMPSKTSKGVLEFDVARRPSFYEETDPQPKKHTVWQASGDFTGGEASMAKTHRLTFAVGQLE
jgi:hypothetical protein